jgi:hypothetical protein
VLHEARHVLFTDAELAGLFLAVDIQFFPPLLPQIALDGLLRYLICGALLCRGGLLKFWQQFIRHMNVAIRHRQNPSSHFPGTMGLSVLSSQVSAVRRRHRG